MHQELGLRGCIISLRDPSRGRRTLHRELCAALPCVARSRGSHDKAVVWAFDTVGLLPGGKLEPTGELRDISALGITTDFPGELLWWLPTPEARTKHRNPLLSEALGITVETIAVATLHTMHL